jgi:hypothetical protein
MWAPSPVLGSFVWIGPDKRACIQWSGQLPYCRQHGNYPETGLWEAKDEVLGELLATPSRALAAMHFLAVPGPATRASQERTDAADWLAEIIANTNSLIMLEIP